MADRELQYKVAVDVEAQALKTLDRDLQSQIAKLRALGQTGSAEFRRLEQQLSRVQGSLSAKGIGGRLHAEFVGLLQELPVLGFFWRAEWRRWSGHGHAGRIDLAAMAAKRGAVEERAIMAVNAALAAIGQLTPAIAAQLRDLASALQDATNIDDEAWSNSFATLIRLGGVSAHEMVRHAQTVQGLAGLLGGDLQQATMVYVRALNGNFEMLGRVGIKLDENATKEEKLAELLGVAVAKIDKTPFIAGWRSCCNTRKSRGVICGAVSELVGDWCV